MNYSNIKEQIQEQFSKNKKLLTNVIVAAALMGTSLNGGTADEPSLITENGIKKINTISKEETKELARTIKIQLAMQMIEPLLDEAISIGHGDRTITAFVDPMCPHSKNYIDMISSSKHLHEMYSYKIYLKKLDKFNKPEADLKSEDLIAKIYQADNPKEAMMQIMVENNNKIKFNPNKDVSEKINTISELGDNVQADRRPYLVIETREMVNAKLKKNGRAAKIKNNIKNNKTSKNKNNNS